MAGKHPLNYVNAMRLVEYDLPDLLPAFPGKDVNYLDQMLIDNAQSLNRPVLQYGLLGVRPCSSRYFNVSQNGFRSVGRDQAWPPERNSRKSVFVFGGSTTLGVHVEDKDTIPAQLQALSDGNGGTVPSEVEGNFEFYNFGSGNYTSRHEMLRFLDLVERGFIPDQAIFIDGYNDCFYALGNDELVRALDQLYQSEKKRRRMPFIKAALDYALESLAQRQGTLVDSASYSPGLHRDQYQPYLSDEAIEDVLQKKTGVNFEAELTQFHEILSKLVWERYLTSVEMIEVIAERHGIKTHFFWQPIPFFKVRPEQRIMEKLFLVYRFGIFGWLIYNWLERRVFGRPELNWLNNIADLASGYDGICYLDQAHYTAGFSRVIAQKVLEILHLKS